MTLKEAERRLCAAGIENARAEARMLFEELSGLPQYALVGGDPSSESEALECAIARRESREPMQYILGKAYFYREVYKVTPDCLIPRSDTEVLVDYAVKSLTRGGAFLDLCCGSGCIGISVLNNTRDTECISVDLSEGAVTLTKENAQNIGVSDRLRALCADVLSEVIDGSFDAVLSNPPYVTDDTYLSLEPEIYREPKMAFVGGTDGMDFYRALTPMYKSKLKKGGFIAYEIGYDQAELIQRVAEENLMSCEIIRDLSDKPRVAVLRPQ